MNNIRNIDRVSYSQILLLMIVYKIMVGLTYMPVVNVSPGNQDAWAVSLLSIAYTIIFGLPLLYLSNKFNHLNLLGFTEKIMGKFLGKIIGVFYILTLLLSNILFVGTSVEILDVALFPTTPTWFSAFLMILTCCYISFKGLKTMARLSEVIAPFIIIMIFLLVIFGYKNYDLTELLPVLRDSTFKEINNGAMDISIRFFDVIVLIMITPNLKSKGDLNKIFLKSVIYSILIGIVFILATQMTLGIEFAKHVNFPFLTFTRMINIGEIQGFDSLYITSWIMGNIVKISGYIYFTTLALGTVTNRKNQGFIIPVSIFILLMVIFIKDRRPLLAVPEPTGRIVQIISIISVVIIPTIMLLVYFFRGKRLRNLS